MFCIKSFNIFDLLHWQTNLECAYKNAHISIFGSERAKQVIYKHIASIYFDLALFGVFYKNQRRHDKKEGQVSIHH